MKEDVWLPFYWGTLVQWRSVLEMTVVSQRLVIICGKAIMKLYENSFLLDGQGFFLGANHLFKVIAASVKVLVEIWSSSSLFWIRTLHCFSLVE